MGPRHVIIHKLASIKQSIRTKYTNYLSSSKGELALVDAT